MNETTLQAGQQMSFTSADWDILREYFKGSIMADTSLAALAANLCMKWPIRGKDETPARYIQYTLDELKDLEEFYGKGNRLPLLYNILLETKRLDEPYVEMARHLEKGDIQELQTPPLFEQLGVPADFPVALMNFSDRTRTICRDGGYETISQLNAFLMESSSAVIINEEFRDLCGCLEHMDASRLGHYLPVRRGARGVFLAEAIGHLARRLSPEQAATLLFAFRIESGNPELKESLVLPKADMLALIAKVKDAAEKYFAAMPYQARQLREAVQGGATAAVRYFVSLEDPDLEALARAIAMAACDQKPRFKGLLGNLLN